MFTDSDPPSKSLHKSHDPPNPTPKPHKPSPISAGELTFSYLCENPKPSLSEKDSISIPAPSSSDRGNLFLLVERDFLHLQNISGVKREVPPDHCKADGPEKKVRIETLNLSLAPPDLSLSLHSANPLPPRRRAFSSNTRATNSEDMSQSCSVPFSHNLSCSLTRNSSENLDVSRDDDRMLQFAAGEGTNGSVHSRFRPLGDGNSITFTNHSGFSHHSVYDGLSFYPAELPARHGRGHAAAVSSEGGRKGVLSRPYKVLRGIVSEPVPIMAQMLQEFPSKLVEEVKDCLRNMMDGPEEFSSLQRKLERRSDLTLETLSKSHRAQLEILVVIKTAVVGFLSAKNNRIPTTELMEIFLMTRCKNPSCKSLLPVDECDCRICTNNKGFCSACMCPICFKFDCASNTCSWVGCDVCSHWCHAICGIQKNLIKPGPSLKGGGGMTEMTEMQFYCPGCDHASEMLGFVKEVFMCCAKDWGLETLMKELECVRMIFQASQDLEGKELQRKAAEKLTMLGKKQISPIDACNAMLQFFKYGVSDLSVTGSSSKNKFAAQASQQENMLPLPSITGLTAITPSKPTFTLNSNPTIFESVDALISDTTPKARVIEPQFVQTKDGSFQSLDTAVRLKEAEAKLFQRLADEAHREMESYRQKAVAKAEKMEEEYTTKLANLCVNEAEEQHRKKIEELKFLENSHCDYQSMRRRMQAEISSLLDRMETTRKQWVKEIVIHYKSTSDKLMNYEVFSCGAFYIAVSKEIYL